MFEEYKDVVTIDELAAMLSIKKYKAYKLIRSGKIRRIDTGKPYLIPKSEVTRFVSEATLE